MGNAARVSVASTPLVTSRRVKPVARYHRSAGLGVSVSRLERADRAECYELNAYARILDDKGKITSIVSNYERVSFNFGPTLLSWMSVHARRVYDPILLADKQSIAALSGHGSALAQVYNPRDPAAVLARAISGRRWCGACDFAFRFGRLPEGMWLAETAVDVASLEALPRKRDLDLPSWRRIKPKARRRRGESSYRDVSGGQVDTSMPYDVVLPSGRRIAVFLRRTDLAGGGV